GRGHRNPGVDPGRSGGGVPLRITAGAAAAARCLLSLRRQGTDGYARRRVEQLLKEGQFAAACRRRAGFERDHMAVLEAEVPGVAHLAVLVEMNRQDRARLDLRIEEG